MLYMAELSFNPISMFPQIILQSRYYIPATFKSVIFDIVLQLNDKLVEVKLRRGLNQPLAGDWFDSNS